LDQGAAPCRQPLARQTLCRRCLAGLDPGPPVAAARSGPDSVLVSFLNEPALPRMRNDPKSCLRNPWQVCRELADSSDGYLRSAVVPVDRGAKPPAQECSQPACRVYANPCERLQCSLPQFRSSVCQFWRASHGLPIWQSLDQLPIRVLAAISKLSPSRGVVENETLWGSGNKNSVTSRRRGDAGRRVGPKNLTSAWLCVARGMGNKNIVTAPRHGGSRKLPIRHGGPARCLWIPPFITRAVGGRQDGGFLPKAAAFRRGAGEHTRPRVWPAAPRRWLSVGRPQRGR